MHLHIISPLDPKEFINSHIASYRLRLSYVFKAAIQLGYKVTGNLSVPRNADFYYIGKLTKNMDQKKITEIIQNLDKKKPSIFIDYTDDLLEAKNIEQKKVYEKLMSINSIAIVPVNGLGEKLKKIGKKFFVIPDGIDNISERHPHLHNNRIKNVLWTGHSSNIDSLLRIISKDLVKYKFNLHMVSNQRFFEIFKNTKFNITPKCNPTGYLWNINKLKDVSKKCDFAILPTDKIWASANRLITAFRLGLPVIAETISSYKEYSDYYCNFDQDSVQNMFNFPENWHQSVIIAQKKYTLFIESKKNFIYSFIFTKLIIFL